MGGILGKSLRAILPETVKRPLRTVRSEARRHGPTVRRQEVAGGHLLRGTGMSGADNVRTALDELELPLAACLVVIAPGETEPQGALELARTTLRGGGRVVAFGTVHESLRVTEESGVVVPESATDRFELRHLLRSHWAAHREPVVAVVGQWRFGLAWAVDETVGTAWTVDAPGVHPRLVRLSTRAADYDVIAGAGACVRAARQPQHDLLLPPTVAGMGVVWVAPRAFRAASMRELTFCAPIRSVGREAFAACTNLRRVILSDSVEFLGDGAFRDCTELRSVELAGGVRSVGAAAFRGCTSLSQVVLPASVRTIGPDAFTDCADDLSLSVVQGSYAHDWVRHHSIPHTLQASAGHARRRDSELLTMRAGVEYQELPGGMLELRRIAEPPGNGRLSVPRRIGSRPVRGLGYQAILPGQAVTTLDLPPDLGWIAPAAVPPGAATKVVTGGRRVQARGRHAISEDLLPPRRSQRLDADAPRLSLRKICSLLETDVPEGGEPDQVDVPFSRLSTSLATTIPGSIYFGQIRRGNTELVHRLLDRGVRAFVSQHQVRDAHGRALPTVVHPRPLVAFERICAWLGQQHPGTRKIAVTGSLGQASTTEMLRRICRRDRETLVSRGHQNGVGQLGRQIQRLSSSTEVFIQATGEGPPARLERGARMLRANALVITSMGDSDRNQASDGTLLSAMVSHDRYMPRSGIAFVDIDDERLRGLRLKHRTITYAIESRDADYYAEDICQSDGTLSFTIVEAQSGERVQATVHAFGRRSVSQAVASFAVSRWLDIPVDTILAGMSAYRGDELQQNLVEIGGQRCLVDCHSESGSTLAGTVEALESTTTTGAGRRVLVFADIDDAPAERAQAIHRSAGRLLAGHDGIDQVVCFGDHAGWAAEELSKAGRSVFSTSDRAQLEEYLRHYLGRENVLAFNGGQKMALPITIDALLATSFHLLDGDLLKQRGTEAAEGGLKFRILEGFGAHVREAEDRATAGEVVVPSRINDTSVQLVGRRAFADSGLVSIVLPPPIRTIAPMAFARCVSLASVSLPGSLRVIGARAFTGCRSLRELTVPEGVTTIEKGAFSRCDNLERVRIPASVQTIGEEVFSYSRSVSVECPPGSYAERFVRDHWPTRTVLTS